MIEKSMKHRKSSSKRVWSDPSLIQKTRKLQPDFMFKWTRKKKVLTELNINTKKEIIKIRAEINKIETEKKISETKSYFFEKINKTDKPLARLNR